MKYFLTVEYTYRTAVEFEADSEEEALKQAEAMASELREEVSIEEMQYDYAMVDEDDRTVIDWV